MFYPSEDSVRKIKSVSVQRPFAAPAVTKKFCHVSDNVAH
jgi:hypothetical protein